MKDKKKPNSRIFYARLAAHDAAWIYRTAEASNQSISHVFSRLVECARNKTVFRIEAHVPAYIQKRELTKLKRKERLKTMAEKLQGGDPIKRERGRPKRIKLPPTENIEIPA